MTELLLQRDTIDREAGVAEFLALAQPLGRFRWVEDCGIHALVFTGNPADRLYKLKFNDPSKGSFLSSPLPGKMVDAREYADYAKLRLNHRGLTEFRNASLAELISELPSLEIVRGKCTGFEIGLAYHIDDKLVSEVTLYSRGQ